MNKTIYQAYNRQANALNSVKRNLADLQAHIEFLAKSGNVDELENLNTKLSSFLDEVITNFINTLPDETISETDSN